LLWLAAATLAIAGCTTSPTITRDTYLFSPYKYVATAFDPATSVIASDITGRVLPVADAMPKGMHALTIAFAAGECGHELWDGVFGTALAAANVRRLDRAGVDYVIATGGANQTFTCATPAAFLAFIETYHSARMVGVDFDIENHQTQAEIDALVADAKAAQARHPDLRFSFTLATFGTTQRGKAALGDTGLMVMRAIEAQRFDTAIINLMVMDYDRPDVQHCTLGARGGCDMGASALAAVEDFHARFKVPYRRIEATAMIGGNDTPGETFTLADARKLAAYARKVGLIGLHYWSFDRDRDCPRGNPARPCNNGAGAGTFAFARAFMGQAR
jgi:hypothetical protein